MKNFLKLNLPTSPFNEKFDRNQPRRPGYELFGPRDILSDEVLSCFDQMQIQPKFVVLFSLNDKQSQSNNRSIHTDIQLRSDDTWRRQIFGINWEIEESDCVFSWWDMSKFKEIYPDNITGSDYQLLNGIHYVFRNYSGVPDGAIKIEETAINGPTLVRTDIPHMTVYDSRTYNRIGISVRFIERHLGTWEDIYRRFLPYQRA